MAPDMDILNKAIRCIDSERTTIRSEADAFRAFRDAVGYARPAGSSGEDGTSLATLAERYRETVLSAPDYKENYGASLADSLEAELTLSTAKALQTDEPLTQRQKRDLLVATTRAVEQREEFDDLLGQERQSIVMVRDDLVDVSASIADLPPCSLVYLSFQEYVGVWDATDALLEQCGALLQDRQEDLSATNRPVRPESDDPHDLSEYLYAGLPTIYPALAAITEVRRQIEQHRQPTATTCTRDHGTGTDTAQDTRQWLNGSSD